ncbi:DNA topoisomerase III [Candidatus Kinetoplastidibacterium crithidiae]|uniref:DNA topoisomerase n=1 Tax=Candidatus Kinetoplastidibacterium crithidiae TCC036E TaxID=1208918 RepID=M1LVN2_9PROT|nr:DNA topoisomerase III [Candidatus Kinetoplastibacterium crithidii]AFZ83032.1 DNA topoisomerase III [Candidatus Kinetoplastibacterium crithidii (ex Angomonas deanei ATCC 30255)]AGF47309.1 DNA topoisomerase III [Candidatus Kinetoplastibacterium crithidii TCC036E]
MKKQLIIAEKPSVALDISKSLGNFKRDVDIYENENYVISSSIGHLLSLTASNDPIKGKWNFTNLPVIPTSFELIPTDKKSSERLKALIKLIKRKDIESIINACDAGREGELIFRYIIQFSKTKKPIFRLWLQSMTKNAICTAFNNLKNDELLKPLEYAARSRAEADWLVGINGTRAMTAFNSKEGGFFKTTVGRVQTPTLAIVNNRENIIKNFIPKDYWEILATFKAKNGVYDAKWIDTKFKKDGLNTDNRESRIWNELEAEKIKQECNNQSGIANEKTKSISQLPPSLYDLTSLQREANHNFGFSAKTTLSLAQALYEKHKAITYPRTDSRYLPEDYIQTVNDVMQSIAENKSKLIENHLTNCALQITNNKWIQPHKKIFDNKKISDHFAIIPTLQIPNKLNDLEHKLYFLLLKRFIAIFFPPAEYMNIIRLTKVNKHTFKTEEKILTKPGWLSVYEKNKNENGEKLISIQENENVITQSIDLNKLYTKPPARYNEATLLSAMEGAGKFINDEELREAINERGLGTPATRASIIEGLLTENYLRRDGKDLIPTSKTFQLMTLLSGLEVKELTSPELTGEWEHKLKQIEQNKLERSQFMSDIINMTKNIVKKAKEYENNNIPGDYVTLESNCPKCNGIIKENYRRYTCTKCDFSISKYPSGRTFELEEVEELIRNKKIGPLDNFISKNFKPFSAILKINEDYKLEFEFNNTSQKIESSIIDKSEDKILGKCPKCNLSVFENESSYLCEGYLSEINHCSFKLNKKILQQEISKDQVIKLLSDKRTDLLDGFISAKTRRKFKAFLIIKKDKVAFEFEKPNKNKN